MAGSRRGQAIPTQLGPGLFEQFVLPHLSTGRRGPAPKLSLFKIFNYILQLLYLGCQWKELLALLSNFGPVVLTDFGPPPVPQPTVPLMDQGTLRGLESQSGFIRATPSGA